MAGEERYFVISISYGDTTVRCYDRQSLLAHLAAAYWGDADAMSPLEFSAIDADTHYWGDRILIIKGCVATVIPPGDWRIE
jgi:hypothetical protein